MKPNFKYAVIHRHRECYPLKQMCQFFEVSRSGYYKYVKQLVHPQKDFELAEKIRAKQEVCQKTYGYRRMKRWLDSEEIVKNPKTILRIMYKYDLLSEKRNGGAWVRIRAVGIQAGAEFEIRPIVRTQLAAVRGTVRTFASGDHMVHGVLNMAQSFVSLVAHLTSPRFSSGAIRSL